MFHSQKGMFWGVITVVLQEWEANIHIEGHRKNNMRILFFDDLNSHNWSCYVRDIGRVTWGIIFDQCMMKNSSVSLWNGILESSRHTWGKKKWHGLRGIIWMMTPLALKYCSGILKCCAGICPKVRKCERICKPGTINLFMEQQITVDSCKLEFFCCRNWILRKYLDIINLLKSHGFQGLQCICYIYQRWATSP